MAAFASGTAEIQLPGDLVVRLEAEDISFEHIATLDTKDGPEKTYEAVWFHGGDKKSPGLAWMVWENPTGVLNDTSSEPLNGAKIISDFEFSIKLDSEERL